MTQPTTPAVPCSRLVQGGAAPTDECLRRAATHIAHDVRTLGDSWRRRHDILGWIVWFVSARSLMDFFSPDCRTGKTKNHDDVCARDYFPSGQWATTLAKLDPLKPANYEAYRVAVNKLAAHLTYTRIEYAEGDQFRPCREVTEYLLGVATLFTRELPPERAAWFGGLML
jgi:hypothetical protein